MSLKEQKVFENVKSASKMLINQLHQDDTKKLTVVTFSTKSRFLCEN